jgi:shikimate dehydrogenase
MSIHCAVIGNPIKQSLSPIIHQYFARQTEIPLRYERIEGSFDGFEQEVINFFSQGGTGLNVTSPFKERAFVLAEKKTSRCLAAKAANTLWMKDGLLHADNTDGIGFMRDLSHYFQPMGKNILIIGAGGAARGLIDPLLAANPKLLTVANRNFERREALQHDYPKVRCVNIDDLQPDFDLVIHASAAGFDEEGLKLPEALLSNQPFCYDLAYKAVAIDLLLKPKSSPSTNNRPCGQAAGIREQAAGIREMEVVTLKQKECFFASILKQSTLFLDYIKNAGCDGIDGLGMLIEQAAESFFIWHGIRPSTIF